MREKFKDRYRIESARMQNWDYSWRGQYYITICTQGRTCYFGEIVDGLMIPSEIGEIAKTEWVKSPEIRPDMNLELDEYVIMPNHIHGIIRIGENIYNQSDNRNIADYNCRRDAMHGVSTSGIKNELLQKGKNKPGPQKKNISSVIRGFKSAVTTDARKINSDFRWQTRFYDCIIRDEGSLNNIRRYIKNNPQNWTRDVLFPENGDNIL